jgi:phage terminase large subunit GpA-like protein
LDWEIPEPEAEPEPEPTTDGSWYFAIACTHCGELFEPGDAAVIQTLNLDQFPLRLTCPHCADSALYRVDHLLPMWRATPSDP